MSWGALNIFDEGNALHNNLDANAFAVVGVRYPYQFGPSGLKFWTTPKGAMLEDGRLNRVFDIQTYLYPKNESPSPTITYEGPQQPYHHIATLAGYDVSEDGDYFASFANACDRLWIGQNAYYTGNIASGFKLNMGSGQWLRPAQEDESDMVSAPDSYDRRPFKSPTLPANDGTWPVLHADQELPSWVNNGWAYKKTTSTMNDLSRWEFGWGEWEDDAIWDVTPNPTAGLDTNLLFLLEKRYQHGAGCGCAPGDNPRQCPCRELVDYRPHYWRTTATTPSQFDPDKLVRSWIAEDNYPYNTTSPDHFRHGWPPWSITAGATSFERTRNLEYRVPVPHTPFYAPHSSPGTRYETGYETVSEGEALIERIPPGTAFDLVVYLEVIDYRILERALSGPEGSQYHSLVASGYFNTKCWCLINQIAPLKPI